MIDLKSYFHDKYQGGENFIENVILPIFGEDKYDDAYEEDVLENNPELIRIADTIGISQILRLGTINIPMNPTDVFDITVSNHVQMERNRVTIQQLVRRIMSTYSSAFMVFHYDDVDKWDWRFTFCSKQSSYQESTDSKRYTFLLGPNQSCRTAAENFKKLASKHGEIELEDIVKAFDVESLSKEFFEKYKVRYGRFVGHVIGKEYVDKGDGKGEWKEKEGLSPSELFYGLSENEKVVRDYVKKLLGRIVFLHFLQKKGWLGATDDEWTNGPQDFMHQLFVNASADQKENFLDDILEPLFTCLDTPLNQRREVFDTKVDGLRSVRVPFLGGLFERTEEDKALSIFPQELFADLFRFLSEYNFTIDENDPNDAQVGVDPEMLGRIFENLLEDNKDKGAFYTPKEIVQYMCRESLIAYLQTNVTDEATREALRQFVTTHDVAALGGRDSALAENVSQCLKDVRICDPAIGSGAFPMGLLNELFFCRGVIEDFSNAAGIKRHIIEQNIYGVDIEMGAVEIARLRFWLSLITDADKPDVLPNMDFKIMQGNSLLEQYNDFDLSHIMDTKMEIHKGYEFKMFEDQIDVIRAEVKDAIKRYYNEPNHDMRRTIREGIKAKIQQQIAIQGINVDISDIKDIAANDQFFLWHTWFSEVFEENGGFDIVIGNPPYISAPAQIANEVLSAQRENIIRSEKFSSLYQKWDLYIPFIEHGIQLLRNGGVTTMIVPYPLTNQTYGKKLRELIMSEYTLFELCDLNGTKIFENATVSNCIPFVRKAKALADSTTIISHIKENRQIEHAFAKSPVDLVPDSKTAVWNVGEEKRDANRHAGMHVLGDYCYISTGMVLNANEKLAKGLFVKSDLISDIPTKINIHPYIEGKNIDRYCINKKRYLEWNTSRCPNMIRRPTFIELYNRDKLLTNKIGPIKATFDDEKLMCDQTNRIIILWHKLHGVSNKSIDGSISKFSSLTRSEMEELSINVDEKYLLAIINSLYVSVLFDDIRGVGNIDVNPEYLRNIPIAPANADQQQPIITLVDRILSAKKLDPQSDTSALEAEIDRLVYDLYCLTEDEIRIVEGTK